MEILKIGGNSLEAKWSQERPLRKLLFVKYAKN